MYSCKNFSRRYFVVVATLSILIQHAKKKDLHIYKDYLVNISASIQMSSCFIATTIQSAGIYHFFLLCLMLSSLQLFVFVSTFFEFVASVRCVERCSFKKEKLPLLLNKPRKELYLQRLFFLPRERRYIFF